MTGHSDKNDTHSDPVREKISEQAFDWLLINDCGEADEAQRKSFANWLKQSPLHAEEYMLLTATWRELDSIDAGNTVCIDQLMSKDTDNVVELTESPHPQAEITAVNNASHARRKRFAWSAAAAALLVLAIVPWMTPPSQQPQHYSTVRGEQQTHTLPDGSVLHLNTQSQVEITYTNNARKVKLLKGEALFKVSGDQSRPFRVTTPHGQIEVLGTEFNVYWRGANTEVTVVEGKVSVAGLSQPPAQQSSLSADFVALTANQKATISGNGEVSVNPSADIAQATAWRQKRLLFREDLLTTVAGQFNRYNERQILIVGQRVSGKRLTGVFNISDPDAFMAFLEADPAVRISVQGNNVLVFDQ